VFFGNFERGMDKHGRILIPKQLREDADFKNRIVIIAGCGDHLEIWSKEQWESEKIKSKEELTKVL